MNSHISKTEKESDEKLVPLQPCTVTATGTCKTKRLLPARPPLAQLFNSTSHNLSSFAGSMVATPSSSSSGCSSESEGSTSTHGHKHLILPPRKSSHPRLDENLPMPPPPEQNSIYDNLSTFTFGSPSCSSTPTQKPISPFHVIIEDDEDRIRSERAKMRAIVADDRTRRPSLPSNLPENDLATVPENEPTEPLTPPEDALDGFDITYIMSARSTNPDQRQNSITQLLPPSSSHPYNDARRPSTASALSDGGSGSDTFFRHIRALDVEYYERRREWSFRRTTKDEEGGEWECKRVGKFGVSRLGGGAAPQSKSSKQRLLIHPSSPSSQSPTTLIHKHSLTNAFSLFRSSSTKPDPSNGVILARMGVQVCYTDTRSTGLLRCYGFLEDEDAGCVDVVPRREIVKKEDEADDGQGDVESGYVRKSHKDALGMLDDKELEAHRHQTHQPIQVYRTVHHPRGRPRGLSAALRRAFASSPTSTTHANPTCLVKGGDGYVPPWIVLLPRNPSMPTSIPRESFDITRYTNNRSEAFEDIPEDSPLMILPLWASSEARTVKERRYLLISYLPLPKRNLKRGRGVGIKEEGEEVQEKEEEERGTSLKSFKVVAKALSYEDVRTSGLRLPNEGIEVSPSSSSPSYSSNTSDSLGDPVVIAIGTEFIPEGLDKLGLCTDSESFELSSVGKAVVEMVWCGCLCVMGFWL